MHLTPHTNSNNINTNLFPRQILHFCIQTEPHLSTLNLEPQPWTLLPCFFAGLETCGRGALRARIQLLTNALPRQCNALAPLIQATVGTLCMFVNALKETSCTAMDEMGKLSGTLSSTFLHNLSARLQSAAGDITQPYDRDEGDDAEVYDVAPTGAWISQHLLHPMLSEATRR